MHNSDILVIPTIDNLTLCSLLSNHGNEVVGILWYTIGTYYKACERRFTFLPSHHHCLTRTLEGTGECEKEVEATREPWLLWMIRGDWMLIPPVVHKSQGWETKTGLSTQQKASSPGLRRLGTTGRWEPGGPGKARYHVGSEKSFLKLH